MPLYEYECKSCDNVVEVLDGTGLRELHARSVAFPALAAAVRGWDNAPAECHGR